MATNTLNAEGNINGPASTPGKQAAADAATTTKVADLPRQVSLLELIRFRLLLVLLIPRVIVANVLLRPPTTSPRSVASSSRVLERTPTRLLSPM